MAVTFTNGRILIDGALHEGVDVGIDGGRIAAVGTGAQVGKIVDLGGAILAPGFIDSQVNGGGDVLFNADPSVEAIAAIGRAHARYGTTGFLPTLISDDLDVIRRGIAAVDAAIEAGVPGVLGIHIEGPFINVARKGIHAAAHIRELDEDGYAALTGLRHGRTLVTLAPERTTPETIRRLVAAGVVVAAGHTDGRYDEICAAMDAGLSGFTHLFNAMSPLGSREPGTVGAALGRADSWCAMIVDGFHVHPATMRLAMRCKPHDRFMLVTDAMPTTGGDRSDFELQGRRIETLDGRLVDSNGTLAGSDLDMARAVRNAVAMLGVPIETALQMASATPAAFLRLPGLGRIAPGGAASFVILDEAGVRATWIDGVCVFER
ncbi:N-acetylglucosamine-6-phosphate deacetylase [Sphingomonas jatrophae]|uniref:N-acetylglucosamine 6-phosphate deacetylase n=1 Tax=Sphingomonas jatrophae TaxID=1166337 RepID=A0A1I6K9C7_9SPHN|nr:N-acetylglucosamine-6-phosphate deacetylase [Sphingomonas jatrophae]SFR87628.1 N-acetylglucosamine 6-phosphate deacetylase [Sphingomonas jatrophae]